VLLRAEHEADQQADDREDDPIAEDADRPEVGVSNSADWGWWRTVTIKLDKVAKSPEGHPEATEKSRTARRVTRIDT
jgi:hypothetical protein